MLLLLILPLLTTAAAVASVWVGLVLNVVDAIAGVVEVVVVVEALLFRGLDSVCAGDSDLSEDSNFVVMGLLLVVSSSSFFCCSCSLT